MKARRVKGLDPAAPLADELQRIVAVRVDEVFGFMPQAADPGQVTALHDLRIATKRLRYVLEIGEGVFGPYAGTAIKRTKDLQDLLGEIHDCDVMSERVRARAEAVAVDDERYVGLEALATFMEARRRVLHRQFVHFWSDLEQKGFRERLEEELAAPA
jgi:CHAD domain-containing protein